MFHIEGQSGHPRAAKASSPTARRGRRLLAPGVYDFPRFSLTTLLAGYVAGCGSLSISLDRGNGRHHHGERDRRERGGYQPVA